MTVRRTTQARFGIVAAIVLAGFGVLYASSLLIASTVLPLSYVIFGMASDIPEDAAVRIERGLATESPWFGQLVEVELDIRNTGPSTLVDLRIEDGVPDDLAVVDGSPFGGFSLGPGEKTTLTYTVVPQTGAYRFKDPVVRLRSLSARKVLTKAIPVDGDDRLTVRSRKPRARDRVSSIAQFGSAGSDAGSGGVAFHSIRKYRSGDPINRIDWRRFAKTNELATVSYRNERAVRTVLLIDVRQLGRIETRSGGPSPAARCGYAGELLYNSFRGVTELPDLVALGIDAASNDLPVGPAGLPWIDRELGDPAVASSLLFDVVRDAVENPPAEREDDARYTTEASVPGYADIGEASNGVRSDPKVGSTLTQREQAQRERKNRVHDDLDRHRILGELLPSSQIIFLTPMLDSWPVTFVRAARDQGYPVSVLVPVGDLPDSLDGRFEKLERAQRVHRAEDMGATLIPWLLGDPIDIVLSNALKNAPIQQYG